MSAPEFFALLALELAAAIAGTVCLWQLAA